MARPPPKLSIGMPVYNGGDYLRLSLDSILQQDYTNYELIISDNASTDNTATICQEYAARDGRIRYFRNETNIGAAGNHTRVVELAQGEFFKWAAHDDLLRPGFLRRCVELLESAPPSVVLAAPRAAVIDGAGRIISHLQVDRLETRRSRPSQRVADVLGRFWIATEQYGVFRIEALRKTRLIGRFHAADYVLMLEVAMLGEIWVVPEVLLHKRYHAGASTNANNTPAKLAAWFDPTQKSKGVLFSRLSFDLVPRTKLGREYMRSVWRMSLSPWERFCCLLVVLFVGSFVELRRLSLEYWKRILVCIPQLLRKATAWFARHVLRMKDSSKLGNGQWVEVRSKEEILQTLDQNGQLARLPFMPEMFDYCGRRYPVYKRAHKTCDTVTGVYKGRKMEDTVHLDGIRCNGQAHGGCDAGCLIYWKDAWLRKVSGPGETPRLGSTDAQVGTGPKTAPATCAEADVVRAAVAPSQGELMEPVYVCQATQALAATAPLSLWDARQYIEDYTSGNVGLRRIAGGFIYMGYKWLADRVRGGRYLRWLYDASAGLRGGYKYPRKRGAIPLGAQTPSAALDLQPGELVRVKSYEEILATCNIRNQNRGMTFDAEMVPYCGRTYRVLKRVTKILNEKTGKMERMKNPCIILEGVVCQSRYSECRLFCPRSIFPYWREIWLERIGDNSRAVPQKDGGKGA